MSTSRTGWRVLAAALALAGAACLIAWSADSTPVESSGPRVETTASVSPAAESKEPAPVPVQATPDSRPVRLTIPGLGVATQLIRLGLQPDGTVEVPKDPDLAGWYRLGPPPGAPGTAVILGHVDSVDGPAVFARLAELGPGRRIQVRLEDGSTVVFVVRSVKTYANADFPAQRVYGGHGRRVLNLVTCGGEYDASRGGYQANVVVNAVFSARNRTTHR